MWSSVCTSIKRGNSSRTSSSTSSELVILNARSLYATSVLAAQYTSIAVPNMSLMSFSRHTLKQLKFVLPGGLITYYLDSYNVLLRILNGEAGKDGWSRCAIHHYLTQARCADRGAIIRFSARLSLFSGAVTISSFLYVLALPLVRGEQPNVSSALYFAQSAGDVQPVLAPQYRSWRQSGVLSTVIPVSSQDTCPPTFLTYVFPGLDRVHSCRLVAASVHTRTVVESGIPRRCNSW